jgi:hypothetical protein
VASNSCRINHPTYCSYHAELIALQKGTETAYQVALRLQDFNVPLLTRDAHCDNSPVADSINGIHLRPDVKELALLNAYHKLRALLNRGIFHLQHVRGEHKPAELLTKTLGYTKLQQLFQTTDLNQAFHFHQTSCKTTTTSSISL